VLLAKGWSEGRMGKRRTLYLSSDADEKRERLKKEKKKKRGVSPGMGHPVLLVPAQEGKKKASKEGEEKKRGLSPDLLLL